MSFIRSCGSSFPHTRGLGQSSFSPSRTVLLPRRNASTLASWLRRVVGSKPAEVKPAEVEAAKAQSRERGETSLFERIEGQKLKKGDLERRIVDGKVKPLKKHTEHRYSTASFKMSHRKLNLLSRQIAGKPIDAAILQMVFSDKRAATRVKSMLCVARDHAESYKGLRRDKLVVAESWVAKGEKLRRVDIKGRGRSGIKHHPKARLHVVLKEGITHEENLDRVRAMKVRKIVSAGLVRERTPIRNPGPMWAW